MGEGRKLEDLATRYEHADNPPTTSLHTLKDWSAKYDWQDRIENHDAEVSRKALAKMQTNLAVERVRAIDLIDDQLKAINDSKEAGKTSDIAKLVETKFKLLGSPLADRYEHSGPGGGPIEHQQVPSYEHITEDAGTAEHMAAITEDLAAKAAGASINGADPPPDTGADSPGNSGGPGVVPDEGPVSDPPPPGTPEPEAG